MQPILQSRLPEAIWMNPATERLPGILPVAGEDWLRLDDAYAGQMAERDRLIAADPDVVHALLPGARAAAGELLDLVLDRLTRLPGFTFAADHVLRPDGARIPLDRSAPLLTLGRLVQTDFCILMPDMAPGAQAEHLLAGAILCFPASWTLSQKIGRPLTRIHVPVPEYGPNLAARVQRLFDAIRPEQPLWRGNALIYDDPTLHQPRAEGVARPQPIQKLYLRSERQCLLRLPQSRAVVFAIHTTVIRIADLDPEARASLLAARA
ncbi:heme-dependent oxidative N-demethylase family protein [Szabonella alba]|uniref:DUF3445 domain-containing protein n=1 Tax=Szabonella alba TaxID=2804194 RepID=A0A8K0VG48_9RHOB|nr:DUF3445 domain-containing protein [Szabonella alba]MBL4919160.1 DUF3445 domain-containing protein [Szabonella alba]